MMFRGNCLTIVQIVRNTLDSHGEYFLEFSRSEELIST